MRLFRQHIGIPISLMMLMLLDGQISSLLATVLPLEFHVVSHLLLIFLLFVSVEITDVAAFLIFLVIGIFYDAYYFRVIGIATLLLPLMSLAVNKYNTIMMANRLTRFLSVLVLVFLFEIVSFLLAHLVNSTSMEMSSFIVYSLAPSMLLNSLILLLLNPVLEKVYL